MNIVKAGLDVGPLVEAISHRPSLWLENTWRQDYVVQYDRPISPQKDTEAVMFRWAQESTIEKVRDSLSVVSLPLLGEMKEVQPLIKECLEAVMAKEWGRTFIAKLKVGGKVIPHSDYGMYSDHFERFHLVLTSDLGNEFFVQGPGGVQESAYMRPGELWWFNHKLPHWAVNDSKKPRMHLIIDAVSPEYRRERASL